MMRDKEAASMKVRVRRLAEAVLCGWLELLTASPVLLVAAVPMADSTSEGAVWLLGLLGYTVWSAAIASVPFLRYTGLLVLCNAAAAAGWAWLLHGLSLLGLSSAAAGMVLAVRGTRLARFGREAGMPSFVLWMGLGACAPAAFIIHRSSVLGGYGSALTGIGILLFVLALFLSNGSALSEATYGGRHISAYAKRMQRFNRALVLGLGAVILAISFWGAIDAALHSAGRLLLRLAGLLLPPEGQSQPVTPQATPAPGERMELPKGGQPAWIWVALEKLMTVIFAALAAAALYLMLRELLRRLPGWIRSLGAWFSRYRGGRLEENAGYVDEVSSIRTGRREPAAPAWPRLKRLLRQERFPRWEDLNTNRERVRFLYALAVRRSVKAGFPWKPQWTPAETAAEAARSPVALPVARELCEAYQAVRYGGAEPEEAAIARLKQRVDGRHHK